MIELSTREYALDLVSKNPDWNVLDLGCGTDGIRCAKVYADFENRKDSYPDNRFVQTEACDTPFEDKEFDFVFTIHLAEHVLDPFAFCAEIARISKRGYIETPKPFFDNFVIGNSNPPPHGHASWVTFDNIEKEIVFKPRFQIVAESCLPCDTTYLAPFFRDSMCTEMYWEDAIELRVDEAIFSITAGNSARPRVVDLRNAEIPSIPGTWSPRPAIELGIAYYLDRYIREAESINATWASSWPASTESYEIKF